MNTVMPTRRWERRYWRQGHHCVAGVDEVGRGPLAGPVTVAAVVLPQRCRLPGVRDSKQLQPQQRLAAAAAVRRIALAIGVGWASNDDIDRLGLSAALRLAGERALAHIADCQVLLLDGSYNYFGDSYRVEVAAKADQSCLAVAAASVVAKVARDRYMELLDACYPHYGFSRNKGYGTLQHRSALERYGPTPHHRRSFAPVGRMAAAGVHN